MGGRTGLIQSTVRYIPGPIPDEVAEEDRQIRVRGGAEIRVRIYTPVSSSSEKEKKQKRPLFVMYHEGGWSMGDLTDEEVNCRLFARDLGAVCVNVEYRSVVPYSRKVCKFQISRVLVSFSV